eukprot:10201903-Ditylum_brightwellii.AAC.1
MKSYSGSSKGMEADMLLEMTIEAYRKKRFIVGCVVANDDSLMRAALRHSYKEQQQTTPVFVWPREPPEEVLGLEPN